MVDELVKRSVEDLADTVQYLSDAFKIRALMARLALAGWRTLTL